MPARNWSQFWVLPTTIALASSPPGKIAGVKYSKPEASMASAITNLMSLSDYWDRNFGHNWGMLIEELRILARGTFVLDAQGVIQYAETVTEMTHEPNYDAALAALKKLV